MPCVVWPVTGHDEYVRHGVNGAVVDFDDLVGTAGWIDLLAGDRALLARLGQGALGTAAAWPTWESSTAAFADALQAIAAGPAPAPEDGMTRLLADLDLGMESQRSALRMERRATEETQRRLKATEQSLEHVTTRLAAIEGSLAWRLAAPLRRLARRRR